MNIEKLRELVRKKVEEENIQEHLSPWLKRFLRGDTKNISVHRVFCLLEFIGYECVPKRRNQR